MGSRLGRRVLHFANLPIKLMLPPSPLSSVQEFAVRTVPSASKVDIRRCLESMYGFSVAEVRTLNMDGKKIRRGSFLAAKPDYKKAYVTLQAPLSVSPDIFPIGAILGQRERMASAAAARRKVVEGAEVEGEREGKGKHWMEDEREGFSRAGCGKVVYGNPGRLGNKRRGRRARPNEQADEKGANFPWNGMRLATEKPARKKPQRNFSGLSRRTTRMSLSTQTPIDHSMFSIEELRRWFNAAEVQHRLDGSSQGGNRLLLAEEQWAVRQ
ncbi:50S ribosomal protein L23 [Hordeum vulgare]|nr:50S ribosomal protein L23 [Hordeum vulgare]